VSDPRIVLAGLTRRLAALAYEALLVTALVLVLGFVMLPLVSPHASGEALSIPSLPARAGLFFVIFGVLAAYFTWSWTAGRATLAQKTWRLRVVDRTGAPLSSRTALARYLASWIGPALAIVAYLLLRPHGLGAHAAWLVGLNFVWAVIDPERQFLHDRIAGTRIASAPSP
jgi:uncharacterized RDD family membrane protein YckC